MDRNPGKKRGLLGRVLPPSHPIRIVLGIRNLRLLWIGEGISVLGSQFYIIAMPWLVLKLTDDPFKMGTVLALAGIPRAFFMLLGGALTDRFSPPLDDDQLQYRPHPRGGSAGR